MEFARTHKRQLFLVGVAIASSLILFSLYRLHHRVCAVDARIDVLEGGVASLIGLGAVRDKHGQPSMCEQKTPIPTIRKPQQPIQLPTLNAQFIGRDVQIPNAAQRDEPRAERSEPKAEPRFDPPFALGELFQIITPMFQQSADVEEMDTTVYHTHAPEIELVDEQGELTHEERIALLDAEIDRELEAENEGA